MSECYAVEFGDMFHQGLNQGWALCLGPTLGIGQNMLRRTFLLFCVPSLAPICQDQLTGKVNVPALVSPGCLRQCPPLVTGSCVRDAGYAGRGGEGEGWLHSRHWVNSFLIIFVWVFTLFSCVTLCVTWIFPLICTLCDKLTVTCPS